MGSTLFVAFFHPRSFRISILLQLLITTHDVMMTMIHIHPSPHADGRFAVIRALFNLIGGIAWIISSIGWLTPLSQFLFLSILVENNCPTPLSFLLLIPHRHTTPSISAAITAVDAMNAVHSRAGPISISQVETLPSCSRTFTLIMG